MTEFSNPKTKFVSVGKSISIFKAPAYYQEAYDFEIKWTYKILKTNEIKSRNAKYYRFSSIDEAYYTWRKDNWEKLFDPLSIKIESIVISRI